MSLELQSVSLRNFRSYVGTHKLVLDRKPGLYYVRGQNDAEPDLEANGAGKSTLWDAVKWCLWGATGRDKKPGDTIESWHRPGSEGTSVALKFLVHGRRFELVRTRRPNHLLLYEDGAERVITDDEVELILGMSQAVFDRTILLSQFGSFFLDLLPGPQAALFAEALELDLWLRASEKAAEARKRQQEELDQLGLDKAKAEGMRDEIERSLKRDLAASAAFVEDTESRVADLKRKKEELQKKLDKLAPASGSMQRQGRSSASEKELLAIDDVVVGLRKKHDALSAQWRDLEDKKLALEATMRMLNKDLERIKASPRVCPVCKQDVKPEHLAAEKRRLNEALDLAEDTLDAIDPKINRLTSERKQLATDIAQREEAVEAERRRKAAIEDEERRKSTEINDLRVQIQALDRNINLVLAATNPYEKAVADLESRQKENDKTLRNLDRDEKELRWLVDASAFWVTEFKNIRLDLMDEALGELEIASNRGAEALGLHGWEIRFATERETKRGDVSYGFHADLYPPGEKEPVRWESYCGGEVQRWHLAVTMGLSEVLLARAGLDPNVEILDEPTQHLSQRGIDDLLDHLRERALKLKRAVYLVDHRALDRGAFDWIITVVKDARGSRIEEGRPGRV